MIKFVPFHDKVVIKHSGKKIGSKHGLLLSAGEEQDLPEGLVVAVGPGRILENGMRAPMSVAEGDTMRFNGYSHEKILIDYEEYLLVCDENITGKVTE